MEVESTPLRMKETFLSLVSHLWSLSGYTELSSAVVIPTVHLSGLPETLHSEAQ